MTRGGRTRQFGSFLGAGTHLTALSFSKAQGDSAALAGQNNSPGALPPVSKPHRRGRPIARNSRFEAENEMLHTDVLIIGAGPTGLVLALWLTRLGVKVRIIDKTAEPGTTSRALAVQARFALHPQIDRRHLVAMLHHNIGQVELPVEFEGAGVRIHLPHGLADQLSRDTAQCRLRRPRAWR